MERRMMTEAVSAFEGDYEYSRGVWQRRQPLEWVKHEWSVVGSKLLAQTYTPAGFESHPDIKLGQYWGMEVGLHFRDDSDDAFPVMLVGRLHECRWVSVLCHDLPDALDVANKFIPLLVEQRAVEDRLIDDNHYGYEGHVERGEYTKGCQHCAKAVGE